VAVKLVVMPVTVMHILVVTSDSDVSDVYSSSDSDAYTSSVSDVYSSSNSSSSD